MRPTRVSAIIPTYNRAGLIGETLDSLLAQTRLPDEILIIDDGSDDGTADILGGYGPALRVVRQENRGKAAALNRALGLASGDLIWIVDDDDILLPDACAQLAGALEADPGLGFCVGRHLDFTHDPQTKHKALRQPGYMRASSPEDIFPDLLEGCHIFQPGLMVRRTVYEQIGPFRTDLVRSQDYEMSLRIARSQRGRQLETVVFWHREHDGMRGQHGKQFAASSNSERWAEYNAIIFSALLNDVEDREIFTQQEWNDTPLPERPRLALVARATIKGRQRMWSEALDDLITAARLDPKPIRAAEHDRVARATLSNLGADNLLRDPALRTKLRTLGNTGVFGKQCRKLLRRSLRWQVRAAVAARDLDRLRILARFYLC